MTLILGCPQENARCKQDLLVAEDGLAMARETVSDMQASLQSGEGKLVLVGF
jgi:hypothetical protein